MASRLPGIVVKIGADTADAVRGIRNVDRQLGRATDHAEQRRATWSKLGGVMKGAAVGGVLALAAGAAKFATDGVQGFLAGETAASALAGTLRDVTGATEAQIAAQEDYITSTQQRTGLDDDELRGGLARLVTSTKDATRAQSLMNTAVKIALRTHKPLPQIVEALAKANDGNVNALKKVTGTLGPATRNQAEYTKQLKVVAKAQDKATDALDNFGPKSKEYRAALKKVREASGRLAELKKGRKWVKELNDQFSTAEADDAATYAGKFRRVVTAFGELEESFMSGLLGELDGAGSSMGSMDDTLYTLGPSAERLGAALGLIATNLASIAQYIDPVVAGLQKADDILGDLPGAGDFSITSSLPDLVGQFTGRVGSLAAQVTGNEQAYYEAAKKAGLWDPRYVAPDATGAAQWHSNSWDVYRLTNPARASRSMEDAFGRGNGRTAAKATKTRRKP